MTAPDDLLKEYLDWERGRAFAWGEGNGDCQLFALGWAEACGYVDPRRWRGLYHNEAQARALLAGRGGAVSAWRALLGHPSSGEARRGAIGLLPVDSWHLAMISTGRYWAMRAEKGICFARQPPAVFWNLDFS